jgi:hypothetical protein
MSLLRDAAALFVEPADERREDPAPAPPRPGRPSRHGGGPRLAGAERPPQRLAVLGSAVSTPALAAAVALSARGKAHAPAALVALWPPPGAARLGPPSGGPALPGAAAVAARLARRDLPAAACGRIVWLPLDEEADAASRTLRHAEAATGDLPSVLAVARRREPAVDILLSERELLIVAAEPDSPLAAAALADLAPLGVPALACLPPAGGAARLAALAGLRAPALDLAGRDRTTTLERHVVHALPVRRSHEEIW